MATFHLTVHCFQTNDYNSLRHHVTSATLLQRCVSAECYYTDRGRNVNIGCVLLKRGDFEAAQSLEIKTTKIYKTTKPYFLL